jgi:maltooligosyltrehalose synthase
VRARINVLSEMPDAWLPALARWGEHNAANKAPVDDEPAPDRPDEYLRHALLPVPVASASYQLLTTTCP